MVGSQDATRDGAVAARTRPHSGAGMSQITEADHGINPRRYFEAIAPERTDAATQDPVCLYLETTNRCNLPCATCPRTFEELEPPANMGFDLFRSIVDQFPHVSRVVLHGIGEPLMVP